MANCHKADFEKVPKIMAWQLTVMLLPAILYTKDGSGVPVAQRGP